VFFSLLFRLFNESINMTLGVGFRGIGALVTKMSRRFDQDRKE
jgi:hypothetical protein